MGTIVLVGALASVGYAQSARRAVMAGRVVDDYGDPVIAARVTIEKRTAAETFTVVASAETDDRGEYRVTGLSSGTYVAAVTTVGGLTTRTAGDQVFRMPGFHTLYVPGVPTAAGAEALTLQPGDERTDIDLLVPAADSTRPAVQRGRGRWGHDCT